MVGPVSSGNEVEGNYLGTDANRTKDLRNSPDGVDLYLRIANKADSRKHEHEKGRG